MTAHHAEAEERWITGPYWPRLVDAPPHQLVGEPAEADRDRPPLLVLHGGPGLPSDYLHGLAALAPAPGVDVLLVDQLGCGRSERPDDPGLRTVSRAVAGVGAVRVGLGLGRVHVLSHSEGAYLALAYVAEHPECAATDVYCRRHLCSLDPWPDLLVRAIEQMGQQTYEVMSGPSEFTATGTLRGNDLSGHLPGAVLTSPWLGSTRDEVRPSTLRSFPAAAGGEVRILLGGTHCRRLSHPTAAGASGCELRCLATPAYRSESAAA